MRLGSLRSLLFVCLTSVLALGQGFQTSFSDVKFDRAKGPVTFNAGVEVDAASGAVSMNIPLGPGIGERGLKFRPTLSMRLAPQFGISSADENFLLYTSSAGIQTWGIQTLDTLYQRSFGSASFSPGTLDLGTMVSTIDARRTSYNLPGGVGGQIFGQVPAAVTLDNIQALLTKFGFSANDTVGYLPGQTTVPLASRTHYLQMGSTGHLVVALRAAGVGDAVMGLTDEVSDDIQATPATSYRWHFPRRMAVIQEDVAYEFHYVNHNYMTRVIPYLANSQKNQLYSGHYLLTRIRNRFGETIDFTYDPDGIGYTATWSADSSIKIRVAAGQAFAAPSGQPQLMDSRYNLTNFTRIQVTYQGISQPVSSYLLELSNPKSGAALGIQSGGGPDSTAANAPNGRRITGSAPSFDVAVQSVQPLRIVQEGSNEEINFHYGLGPAVSWTTTTITPTILTSVSFPTRVVNLNWVAFRFRMNYNVESWGGTTSGTQPGRPAFTCGVVGVTDGRGYSHARVTPISNWITDIPPPGTIPTDQWVNTTFYDAITHPDGTISVHRFMEPPATPGGLQDLAFLKNLEREVRYYAPGTDWQADLSVTIPASSSAYKWVIKDRLDVRSVSAPTGSPVDQPAPYPTRVRTWDKESQVLTIEETTDWDADARGWKTTHRTNSITSSPTLTFDLLSLALQGLSYSPYPASKGLYRRVDKTFEPKLSEWIFARVKTEQTTTIEDNTGFLANDVALPDPQPLLTRTFNSAINRVDSVDVAKTGAPTVTTAFTFQGTSGLAGIELLSTYLSSPNLVLSGQLGVSGYSYDALGYLNAINQKPNAGTTLTVSQVSDELGRPKAQTDMNGTVKTFAWDQAGRLSGISSSDMDESTSLVYNTDHLGVTVSRGSQVSEYRYNGYGELILERRTAPDGTKSHRINGYDMAGRRTGETVWQPGDGVAHESDWSKANLFVSVTTTTTTPSTKVCKKWGLDANGNDICLTWQTIPATTTTTTDPALYKGSRVVYDTRSRVILTQDANGVQVTTEYFGPGTLPPGVSYVGPIRKITVGSSQVKWFESDVVGRLVRVTTPVTRYSDPLNALSGTIQNLRTEYRYDGGDRIKEVKQFDEANRVQTRTWGYNPLGWLTTLGQPESGTTTYSAFTVAGKPTVTSYNGRTVIMTPDWMGRPVSVTAADGTVAQSFVYDTVVNGKGRIASSTDGSVTTAYSYGGQGKRLDNLTTTVLVQGALQSFTQTFAYDTYGNRTGGNTSHAAWAQTYHVAAGLPNVLNYGTGGVASTPWTSYDPTSWALKRVDYGNGTLSLFDYGADQARLAQVTHSPASGGPFAQWAYTYDSVGNLVRENDVLTGAFDQYGYDELNRLISAVVQSPTYGEQLQEFDYDAFGNRVSSNIQRVTGWAGAKGASTAYITPSPLISLSGRSLVNAAFIQGSPALLNNQLPATTSTGVPTGAQYDLQGNLTQVYEKPTSVSPVVITLTYDALGRVIQMGSTRTGITEKYQYNTEGLRTVVQEYIGANLQKTRLNLYNDGRQLVSQHEKTAAGLLTWKRDIIYLGNREAAEFDAAGMHVTQVDHLGSPRIVTNQAGSVESTQKFLPFGELLEGPGLFKTAKGYTNHEQTDASGLIYMQARFYHPGFGRFTAPDPARDQHFEDTQSWNIYSYVRNSPIMSTDPTGMVEEDKKNATETKGPQGGMSGTDDYSRLWQNDWNKWAQTSGIIASGFSLSSLNGQAFAASGGVFIKGADLASSSFVSANAQGNIDLMALAGAPGAQFTAPAENFTKSDQFASIKVATDFFNLASTYHAENSTADKLVINGANKNDGSLFKPHDNSHTTAKPAIDVAYQNAQGKNLSGRSASSLAGVDRTRDFLRMAGKFGFTRTVTYIENIGSFQVRQNHDNHIHLGE